MLWSLLLALGSVVAALGLAATVKAGDDAMDRVLEDDLSYDTCLWS